MAGIEWLRPSETAVRTHMALHKIGQAATQTKMCVRPSLAKEFGLIS